MKHCMLTVKNQLKDGIFKKEHLDRKLSRNTHYRPSIIRN